MNAIGMSRIESSCFFTRCRRRSSGPSKSGSATSYDSDIGTALCAGMMAFVYVLQARVREVRVHLRGADIGVAEHGLHCAQVGAALEELGRERGAQLVRRDRFSDAGRDRVGA